MATPAVMQQQACPCLSLQTYALIPSFHVPAIGFLPLRLCAYSTALFAWNPPAANIFPTLLHLICQDSFIFQDSAGVISLRCHTHQPGDDKLEKISKTRRREGN